MSRPRTRLGPRPVRQSRAAATQEALVTAGELLLDGRDPEAIAMDDLLARAGVSPSSFYQRFASKQHFVDHLHERFCARIGAEVDSFCEPSRFAGRVLEDVAREAVDAYLAFRREHVGAFLSFEIVERRHAHLLERRRRVDLAALQRVRSCLGALRTRDDRAPNLGRLDVAIDLVVSAMRSAVDGASRAHACRDLPDGAIADQVTSAMLGFLIG